MKKEDLSVPISPLTSTLTEQIMMLISHLDADSPLPSERSLAEKYGVSRVTLRKALSELADDGLIFTIHGAGSFVSQPRVTKRLKLLSFSDEIRGRGLTPTTKIISTQLLIPDELDNDATLEFIDEPTYKITRLRLGNSEPLSHETTLIAESIAPGLLELDLTKSIYSILQNQYNVKFDYAEEQISPVVVSSSMAQLLNLKKGQPAFEIKRTAFNQRGLQIERSTSVRRGDRWAFKYTVKV